MTISADGRRKRERMTSFLDSWDSTPAVLCTRHFDVLGANRLGRALSPAFSEGENLVRFAYLAAERMPDDPTWQTMSAAAAGLLRRRMNEYDADRHAMRVIGELLAKSHEFSEDWASEDLPAEPTGPVRFPTAAGMVEVNYTLLTLQGAEDDAVLVFTAASDDARAVLRSLTERQSG